MLTHGVVEDENGRYEGELKKGKRHGQGTYIYTKNGHSYIGHWSNNVRDGAGSMHFRNGDVLTCRWSHDQYVESQRAAVMKYKAKDETYIGAMTCTHLRHGQGELTHADGSYYKGEWKWDERHGRGLQRYVSGDTYEGSWRDGRRHGTGVYTWSNSNGSGATWRGSWNQDKPTGQGIFTLQGHQRKGEFDQHVTLLADLAREVATSGPIVSDSPTQHVQKSKSRQSLGALTSTSAASSKKKSKKQLRTSAGSATERKWEEDEDGNNEDEKEEEVSGSGLLGGLKRILFSKKAHTLDGAISPRTIASYTNSTQQTSSSQLISSASTSPTATIKTLQTTSSPATTNNSKVPPLPLRHVPEDSQQTTIEHDDYDYTDPISITETHVAPASTSITPAMYQSRTRSQRKKHGERPSMSRSITQKKESITRTAAVASAPISSSSVHASPSTETRELTSPTSSISSPTAAQVNFVQLAVRHPQQQLKRTTSSFLPSRSKKFATVPSSVLSDALASPTLSDVLIPTDAPSANFKAITEEKEHTTNPSHTRQCSVGANLSKHDDEKQLPPSPIPSQSEKKHSATPIRYESDRLRHARAAAEQAAHEERLKEMHIIKSIFSILKKEEIEERIAEKEKQSNEKKSRSHEKKSRSSHRSSGIKHSPSISANSTGSNISVAMVNPDDREEDVINKIASEEQRQHRMLDEIEALSPATKKEYLRAKRRQTEQAWTQHALDEFIRDQGLDKQISPKRRLQISPTHRQTSPMNRHSPARQRKSSPSPNRIKSHPSPHHLKTPTIRKAPSHFRFSPPATAQRHLHSPSITSTLYIHDDTDEMDSYILSEDIESFLDANKPATPQGLIPPKRTTLTGKGNKRSSTTSPSAQGGGGGGALPMTALAHLISAQKSPPRHTPSPTSLAPSHSTFPSAKLSSIDDDHPYSTKSFSAVDGMDTGTDIETEDEFDAAIAEEEALQAEMDREEQQKMDDALRQEDKAYQRRAAMETERKRREQEMKDTKLRGSKMNLFKCVAEEAVRRVREKELQKMGKVHHRTESTAQKTAALVEMAQMAMVLYRQAQDATVPQKMISAMKQNKENSTRSPPITTTTLTVTASPTARPKLSVNNLESPTRSASFSFSPTSLAQKMKQQMASQMGPTTTKQAKQSVSKTHIQIKKRSPAITPAVPNSPARCGTTEVESARRSMITSVR